jgi:putative ABC transport system ATP-binding protein
LLEAANVSRWDGSAKNVLLADVSLSLGPGERLGLGGPSGAGKTLLLRTLALLDPASSGQILWQGSTVHRGRVPTFRSRAMYLHQRPVLVEGSVEHNLQLPFTLREYRHQQFQRTRVVNWLRDLDRDEDFLGKSGQDLSGGESQLAGLVRAIQLDPVVLLLDEPTAALDGHTTALVEKLMAAWLAERPGERAYVWVSHNSQQTERMCESVVQMERGRIKREGVGTSG